MFHSIIEVLIFLFFLPGIWPEELDYLPGKENNSVDNDIDVLSDEDLLFEESNTNNSDDNELKNLDCLDNDTENDRRLRAVFKMMKDGDEEIKKQGEKKEKTILLLGNFGAGKTTLVQFMAGNETKLISKDDGTNSAHYIIEDGDKIGHSMAKPIILYPEQVVIDSESSFTDTPGFSVMRSERRELVATYFLKKYLQDIKYMKIVILVMYHSLEYGMYKGDFTNLLYNIINLIKDIDKYKDSIALVATKVPLTFEITRENVTAVSDDRMIESVATYIFNVKNSMILKLKNHVFSTGSEFLKKAIKITDYLLEKDENGRYKRINIFRQPIEAGYIFNMTLYKRVKPSLQKTIYDKINYTKFDVNDFDYQLPEKSKNYLDCLLWYINKNISKMSHHIFESIENHYETKVNKSKDIYELRSKLEDILKKLKSFKNNLIGSNDYKDYLSVIRDFKDNETIEMNEREIFYDLDDSLADLEQFAKVNLTVLPYKWSNSIKKLKKYIDDQLSRNEYLIDIFERFSSYDVQKSKTNYITKNNFPETKDDFNNLLNGICETSQFKNHQLHNILSGIIDQNTTADIDELILQSLFTGNNISCNDNGTLILKGNYILLSEISNASEIITKYCESKPFNKIVIYAMYTIFIDTDLNDDLFKGVNLIITAPKWEIIGNRTVDISGRRGMSHNNSRAEDGVKFGDSGQDGMPGYPGGNGGNFLGIGLNFSNKDILTINANGGDGGPGQDGGHGKIGINGTGGYDKFYFHQPNETNYNEFWEYGFKEQQFEGGSWVNISDVLTEMRVQHCSLNIKLYRQSGDCGSPGGQGGNGGVGGFGGNPGKIIIFDVDKLPNINETNKRGNTGQPGKGGNAGKIGEVGRTVECFKTFIHEDAHTLMCNGTERHGMNYFNEPFCTAHNPSHSERFWICRYLNETVICPETSAKFGLSNYNATDILEPEIPKEFEFFDDILNYTFILEDTKTNKFISNYTNKFLNELKKRFQ